MTPRRVPEGSLRLGRFELTSLALALGISLLVHVGGYGAYELAKSEGLLHYIHLPAWLQASIPVKPEQTQKETTPREAPLMFVDVNPAVATPEPPPAAKFYSDKNSKAANPDVDQITEVPKIDGKQKDVVKTEDTKRSQFDKLQPSYPKADTEQPEERAKPTTPKIGDLAMAKPDLNLHPDTGTAEHSRPRTIREALLKQNRNMLVGQKMKQDGGVDHHVDYVGLDTKATLTGSYDAAFIDTVENRWFDLLDSMSYDGYRRGKVVLQFHLNFDGRISDMKILQNNVGESLGLLCEKAILDPAPFDKWPREMRLVVDKDYREIQFAFYYN